ncbi:MAG TPA: trigger factor, partial [Candidatus Paceibacterota bacterium]|nr:trigger factor [Candidatus Paceibacterota bacterium]
MEKSYEHLKSLKEKNGAAEFEAEIPEAALEAHMRTELARTGRDLSVPGFRKGKVPEHMLREYVDERELLEAAADKALNDAVREIIKDEALSILGRPELTITEVAPKKPVRFKMRVALFPAIALPDYKTISATIVGRRTAAAATDTNMDAKAKANTGADEKELLAAKEAEREEIMNEIVKRAKVRVPELLIDQEWRAFVEARDADLARAGLPLEEYLKQIKKDEKSLEKDERALIEKQIV